MFKSLNLPLRHKKVNIVYADFGNSLVYSGTRYLHKGTYYKLEKLAPSPSKKTFNSTSLSIPYSV